MEASENYSNNSGSGLSMAMIPDQKPAQTKQQLSVYSNNPNFGPSQRKPSKKQLAKSTTSYTRNNNHSGSGVVTLGEKA